MKTFKNKEDDLSEKTKLILKVFNSFVLNIFPYIVMIGMAIGIHIIADHPNTIYIIILTLIMLAVRFLFYMHEIGKMIEEYKGELK